MPATCSRSRGCRPVAGWPAAAAVLSPGLLGRRLGPERRSGPSAVLAEPRLCPPPPRAPLPGLRLCGLSAPLCPHTDHRPLALACQARGGHRPRLWWSPHGVSQAPGNQSRPRAGEPPPLQDGLTLRRGTPRPPWCRLSEQKPPARKPQAYLLADLTHGEVLVVTGACHTDVLEPAARPGLIRVHTELLAAQLFRDLPQKRERRDGSEASSLQEPSCLGSEWQAVRRLAVSARSGHQEVPGPPSRPPRGLGEFSGGGGGPFLPHRAGHWPRTRGAASIANAPQQSRPTCENAEASASQNEPSAEGSWGAGMQKTVLEGKGVGACGCPRAWA